MRRRQFITLLGGTAVSLPLAVHAEQPAMPVIGFLCSGSADAFAPLVAAFRGGLKEAGYVEGRNIAIEFAWAAGQYDKLPSLAANLVKRQVTVIAAVGGAVAGLAAKAATSTIPIVVATGDDPVKYGLVGSLSRPTGNITGVTLFIDVLTGKRVEILAEVAPTAAFALLVNQRNPNAETEAYDARAAAQQTGRELRVLAASNEGEIATAFAALARQAGAALMIGTDTFFYSQPAQLVELAAQHAIPTIYFHRLFALAGGLIAYGVTFTDELRMAGRYVGRILAGEKPNKLPILQPSKFEMVINLKTAKALGLTLPATLLTRADQVIE
ncbi:ABC transporter substrate-binding protein [Bradyrhizobium sp. B124]|uniref:ABC transporter substrate-binding protein n=1 Tax=Bradyrhizobium sp. B124 TaxID=3140245 RepID=UPI0031842476